MCNNSCWPVVSSLPESLLCSWNPWCLEGDTTEIGHEEQDSGMTTILGKVKEFDPRKKSGPTTWSG